MPTYRYFIVLLACCEVVLIPEAAAQSESASTAPTALAPSAPAAPVPAAPASVAAPPFANSDPEGAEGLLSDLKRIVQSVEGGGGWFIDRDAYANIESALLESVCRSTHAARREALRVTEQRRTALGDPRDVFDAEGRRETARFEIARTASRQHLALTRALEAAEADCPFWETPKHGFSGRQSDRKRFTLSLETGGNVQLRQTEGSWTFGAGGLGRLLPGYGLTENFTLLAGLEFGGGAMLRSGAPTTEFVINYFPAIPVILRYRVLDWHYSLEFGPVALFQADNTDPSYGGRIGASIGLYGLRTRNLIPWAGVVGAYEYFFERDSRPQSHFLRGGLRVGIIWDPQ